MSRIARKVSLLPLLFFGATLAEPAATPELLSYYNLGMAEGLAGPGVRAILQDQRGLMWFGGSGGLSRYDGHSFATYRPELGPGTPASSLVMALLEDPDGGIFVATDGGGLLHLDPPTGRFEACSSTSTVGGASGGMVRSLRLTQDRQGRVYVGTATGEIYRNEKGGRTFARFGIALSPSTALRCLLADARGRLWAGTDGAGLYCFDETGAELGNYRHSSNDIASIGDDRVESLFEDTLGSLWIGFGDGGIDIRDEAGFRHAKWEKAIQAPRRPVRSLAEDPEGMIWAGYEGAGISSIDPSSLLMARADSGESLRVGALLRDRRGLMWVGTEDEGIRVYNGRSSLVTRYDATKNRIALRGAGALAEGPGGRVFAVSGGGLLALDPRSGELSGVPIFPAADKPGLTVILGSRHGGLWLGTEGGGLLLREPDGRLRRWSHLDDNQASLGAGAISLLVEEEDGSLWIGLEGLGLDRLDADRATFSHFRSGRGGTGPGTLVRGVARDASGRLWVGTADAGLSVLDASGGKFVTAGHADSSGLRVPGGIDDSNINCVFRDRSGSLWVGTGGSGLYRLDPEGGDFVPVRGPDALLGDGVYGLAEDGDGVLWIASSRGLVSHDPSVGSYFLFGPEDGLIQGDQSALIVYAAVEGSMWIGGRGGLCRFDPRRMPHFAPQPDIIITGINTVGGGALGRSADGSEIVLSHDNGGLSFRIAVIDYVAPARNRYAFRLEGLQGAWTSLGGENAGFIAPLAPGRYTLRARGSNGNGVWNDYGTSLRIIVRPPFWEVWWFRALVALLFAGALALAIAARVRVFRNRNRLLVKFASHIETAREEERKLAARDVHDEIGQDLMVLNIHTFWLASHAEADATERMRRIGEMQERILAAMSSVKSVATRLRPEALDALEFPDALKWYVKSFDRLDGFQVRAEIGKLESRIEGELATALFRMLQEMLSNVVRHARAKQVVVGLAELAGDILLEVADDGVGMETGAKSAFDSFGMIGMRERCAAFGGRLEVESQQGRGTTVRARIPIGKITKARAKKGTGRGGS